MGDFDMSLRRLDDVGSILSAEIEFLLDVGYEAGTMTASW